MKFLSATVGLIALLSISGCGKTPESMPPDEVLRNLLIKHSNLIDPASAQFRALKTNSRRTQFCGQINAKNKSGGYVGWTYFYASIDKLASGKESFYFQEGNNPLGAGSPYLFYPEQVRKFCE